MRELLELINNCRVNKTRSGYIVKNGTGDIIGRFSAGDDAEFANAVYAAIYDYIDSRATKYRGCWEYLNAVFEAIDKRAEQYAAIYFKEVKG